MKVATPLVSVPVPRALLPSRNVTKPVAAAGVTTARKATGCPAATEAGVAVSTVVELVLGMVNVTGVEVLPANLLSPPYIAVTLCEPAPRLLVVKVAVALASEAVSVPVPKVVVPSTKVTVPVAPGGVTVAVKVTA